MTEWLISPEDHRGSTSKCHNIATHHDNKTRCPSLTTTLILKHTNNCNPTARLFTSTHLLWHTTAVGLACREETFPSSVSFSLHRSGLTTSQSHQIWPGFHGWILEHTHAHSQHSDLLRGKMSPLIFICLELIEVSFCGQRVTLVTASVSTDSHVTFCRVQPTLTGQSYPFSVCEL